jgi:Tol biopolymer transport system component
MPLTSGTKLGSYEIVAPIGAGGMGEVYRARDTKLGRDVAIKIVPEHFAQDRQRMARFEREAQLLAALNHPHIAHIYGFEDSNGMPALVMELVEGPTLAELIEQGPLPLEESLRIARQVAEALEYAHDRGIIHRDLKPANVKLTADGNVKILDFGLAKALEDEKATTDISHSPTLTVAATQAGIVLGTAAYMSPEQAKGKSADRRADIWSFGVLLFEMLTGKKLYEADTAQETLAAVLIKEPSLDSLPANIPPRLRILLRRCLTKDSRMRLQAIGEARIAIDEILSGSVPEEAPSVIPPLPAHGKNRERTAWAIAGVVTLIAIALALGFEERAPKPAQLMRLNAELGADVALYTEFGANAVLSSDGTRVVFVAVGADKSRRLYIRSLDQMQATLLSGTEDAYDPFFSPDDQWIAFFAGGKLKKIFVQGGAVVTLCDALNDRGGSWGDDNSIVFAAGSLEGLSKISSTGGKPEPLTTLNPQAGEVTHRWPQVLPGSKDVIFTDHATGGQFDDADIAVYSTVSGKVKTLLHGGSYARYLPSGHLVYVHNGTLFAVPLDIKRLEVTGQAAPVVEGVASNPGSGGAQFSFSDSGTFVYVAGSAASQDVSIYWLDAAGKFTPLRETPGNYNNLSISPDGKRIAMEITNGNRADIWVYEWERDTLTRLTFKGDSNVRPVWTPDGQRIVYTSTQKGAAANIWWIRADGGGDAQRLTESNYAQDPNSWSPDGKILAFQQDNPGTGQDLMTMSVEGSEKAGWKPGEPKPFVSTPATEVRPAFSHDGRWIAYHSNESGSFEVYVRPFPGPGGKTQISMGGGSAPQWSRNGKELYFTTSNRDKIMVATYTASGESFHPDKPRLWSPGQFTPRGTGINYALHTDGKRIAVLKAPNATEALPIKNVSFIFNFFDELRRKVPAGKN